MTKPLAVLLLALALAGPAAAHDYTVGDLTIEHPFARATAGPARAGAAYLAIENGGDRPDRLVGAATGVAERAMLHQTVQEGGVMRMRHLADGVAVPAGGLVALEPGGLHIMLMGLAGPLTEGASFPLTLTFERAGEITVEVEVEGVAAGAN